MEQELTVRDAIARLSEEDRDELITHVKDAVFHMASCWDALRQVEGLLDGPEVETEAIEGLAGDTTDPADAYKFTAEQVLDGWVGIE